MAISLINDLSENTISINDLRRNFGKVEKRLPLIDRLVITKNGKPFAILTAAPEVKKKLMKSTAGALKNTEFDNDKLWEDILVRRSRKEFTKL